MDTNFRIDIYDTIITKSQAAQNVCARLDKEQRQCSAEELLVLAFAADRLAWAANCQYLTSVCLSCMYIHTYV